MFSIISDCFECIVSYCCCCCVVIHNEVPESKTKITKKIYVVPENNSESKSVNNKTFTI